MEPVNNKPLPKANVAVLVARFQLHMLHQAHTELIDTALRNHSRVIIVLGLSQVKGSINDPLDFQTRKQMILEAYPSTDYPNLSICYIADNPSDKKWSKNLDAIISAQCGPNDEVVLYGSRDSFISYYSGNYNTVELKATISISATEIRKQVANAPVSAPDFRAGVIWGAYQRYPTVYSTVDIALIDRPNNKILLGRKSTDQFLRFPGGFADPLVDKSFEDSAKRELREETGINVTGVHCIGTTIVNDWRYRDNPNEKIFTHLYVGFYSMGPIVAGDDLASVQWVDLKNLNENLFVPEHVELFKMLKTEFLDNRVTQDYIKAKLGVGVAK